MQENWEKCKSVDPDTRISGCTAVLKSGLLTNLLTSEKLSNIYVNLGTAYYNKGDYDRAIQDYDQAIHLDPKYMPAYYSRGSTYFKKGDFDRAIQDYDQAIRLNPNDARSYYNRGLAYDKRGDFDRAIQDCNQAIRLNPNDASGYYVRGNANLNKDDYDRAIQDYDQAIHLSPNEAHSYNNRGNAYAFKGDYGRAVQDYNQAIRLMSNDMTAYGNRGDAYFAQSNLTAAIADYEHTISAAPSSRAAVSAALMLHVIMNRQGHDDTQQLARVAAAADLSKWPGPVLKLDMGQMTANDVLMAPTSPIPEIRKRQVCGANYFIGEDALFHRQRATALARFKAASDGCPKGDTTYALALAELKRLGASTAPEK